MQRLTLKFAVVICLLGPAGPARCGIVLDQASLGPATAALSLTSPAQEAQTFTVGVSGQLVEIDVRLQYGLRSEFPAPVFSGNLNFFVQNASGGQPPLSTTPFLATGSIPIASLSFAGFDALTGFSIPVVAGNQLSILLTPDQSDVSLAWQIQDVASTYAGGQAYARTDPLNDPWFDQGGDYLFKTFVDTPNSSPVPEPSRLAVCLSAGVCLVSAGWCRRWIHDRRSGRDSHSPRQN